MIDELLLETEDMMETRVRVLKDDFSVVRAGRATPALLERVRVDYYGAPTPINQLASISAPEPRLLVIQPWDKGAIGDIEKAILTSDLGLTPQNDGNVIRLVIPQLTEERRQELIRNLRKRAEEERVAVRNIRRSSNDQIKDLEKSGDLSEDDARRTQEQVQELTDKYIETINQLLESKEKEMMEV